MNVYNIVQILVINSLFMVIVVALCAKKINAIYHIWKSVKEVGKVAGGGNKNTTYIWLILQALCCIMCWSPVQISLVISLCGVEMPSDYIAWSLIILMILNSLVNPVMYTLKNIKFKLET